MQRETHYEVLGLPRRASQEQIEKAYQFLRQMYDDASLATYSLLDPEETKAARARVNEAHEVLRDPIRRRDYDASLDIAAREKTVLSFSAGTLSEPQPATPPPHTATPPPAVAAPNRPEPPAPPIVLTGPVTGDHLRRLREQKGVSLQSIAATSKVGVRFLEYIETDRHSHLPARVYLRGFLQEYARALGLSPESVAEAYLGRLPK
jgi:flagellar biosynthesis protein FlhG